MATSRMMMIGMIRKVGRTGHGPENDRILGTSSAGKRRFASSTSRRMMGKGGRAMRRSSRSSTLRTTGGAPGSCRPHPVCPGWPRAKKVTGDKRTSSRKHPCFQMMMMMVISMTEGTAGRTIGMGWMKTAEGPNLAVNIKAIGTLPSATTAINLGTYLETVRSLVSPANKAGPGATHKETTTNSATSATTAIDLGI